MSFFKYVTSLKKFGNGYNGPWEFFAKLFIEGNGKFVSVFSSKNLKGNLVPGACAFVASGDRTHDALGEIKNGT